jgi:antitoxin (DNA-binding transcriptional repressor) of toxin-antitoxin stability system
MVMDDSARIAHRRATGAIVDRELASFRHAGLESLSYLDMLPLEMDKNEWNVGEAKQQFSEVLRRSASEPQLIYRRSHLIAAVVAMDASKQGGPPTRVTIGDRFEEARELFREEAYRLPQVRRRSRRNGFVRTLDAVARGHKRPE